jgi:GT2 family glycosyltransferase
MVVQDNLPSNIAVIILNWNNPGDTSRCVEGILSWKEITPWIIVVENGSSDGSAEELEARFPGVTILKSKVNLGFTGGNNLAIKKAMEQNVEYILLLNNDASLNEGDAASLLRAMAGRPDLGTIGPRLKEGSDVYAGGADIGRNLNTRIRWSQDMGSGGIKIVDYVPGTALLIRREAIEKAGLLDENFFFSGEVADLCMRIYEAGMLCGVDLYSEVTHLVEGYTPARDTLYIYYNLRNRFLYVKKHYNGQRYLLQGLWSAYCIWETISSFAKGKTGRSRAALFAMIDGMAGRFGDRNDRFIAGR